MCLREGREVAAGAGWNCPCCCVSGDGLLQSRVVSAAAFGVTDVLLRVLRAAVPLQAHLWPLWRLHNMFVFRDETVMCGQLGHLGMMQNDIKDVLKVMVQEESLGEAFRAGRWKELAGLRVFLRFSLA